MDSQLISCVNCRSRFRTNLLQFRTLDSIVLWAFLCFLSMTTGQELLFIPDVVQTDGFVENRESRELVPIQGAYPWFLCRNASGNDTRPNQGCPESSSLVIHTRSTMIFLNLLSINEEGVPTPISQRPTFQIFSNSPETTARIEPDRRRNEVYNISVVSEADIDEFTLTASLGTSSRRINIRMDREPPQVEIRPSLTTDVEGPPRVLFLVVFNEEVFVNTNNATCQVELMPLSIDHPADELVRRSEECNTTLFLTNFSEAFNLSVPNHTRVSYSQSLRAGNEFYVRVFVFLLQNITTNVTLEIPANSVLDRAGNRNTESRVESVFYQREQDDPLEDISPIIPPEDAPVISLPEESPQIVERWEPAFSSTDVGEASVVILVTSIVLSLIASIASSFVGGAISPGSMRMLNQAQKLHMTGRLAVVWMPFTYRNFTEQFGWAMFDTVGISPDSGDNAEHSSVEDPMLQIEEAPRIAYTNDHEEHYRDYLNQIVFWMPLLLVSLVFGHLIVVCLLFDYKKDIPSFFTFPRLEIMFGYFSTPIIATASAGLFQGDKNQERFIGIWMLIAFVFSFICFNIFVVWHTFYYTSENERKANMFIDLGWHNDHESQFLSKAYKFLSKRSSRPNRTQSNLLRSILHLLRAPRGQGNQQQGLDTQAPTSTTPPQSIELVTPPQTPSQFAVHIGGHATTSAGCDRPSTSAEIELAQSSTEADEEEGETEYTTTTTYDRPYTTTTSVSPQVDSQHEYKNLGECCYGCWEWTVLSTVLGHAQPTVTWVGNKSDGSEFLAAYGYVFEEYRGPRVVREEATYSIDSTTGRVNRGFLVTVLEPPVLAFPCLCGLRCQVQRFHIQLSFRVIDLLKLVVMGCLTGGINNTENNDAQVIALLIVSCIMFTLMRIARPFLNRIDMAIGMFSEAADIFTFAMLLIILSSSPRMDRRRFEQVGVAMMVVQCIVLAVMVLRHAVSTTSVTFTCASYIRNQNHQPQQNKLIKLIWRCHPLSLERKYFDMWVVKALHKGLNGRRVKASELPRSVAAMRYFHELRDRMFRIFSLKKQRI